MQKKPKIIFFGNSKYSVIVAKALHERFGLSAIVTVPNKKAGRNKDSVSPVKIYGESADIEIIECEKLTAEENSRISSFNPDFFVVADYGLILPKSILRIPKIAPINVHHSLLPKYRGPSPVPAAILNGEKEAGVSIIIMSEKVDAGDILKQVVCGIEPDETTDSLLTKLNVLGASATIEVLEDFPNAKANAVRQDESKASYTRFMARTDGSIDLSGDPKINWRKIRAYGTWPGTYFVSERRGRDTRVKITEARLNDGNLEIIKVIPEGKREMLYSDFLRGVN